MRATDHVRLALTMGDPRGIGPEIIVKALPALAALDGADVLVVGCRAVLERAAECVGTPLDLPASDGPALPAGARAALWDLDNFDAAAVEPRRPDAAAGRASLDYIERAVAAVLDGHADAVVTCPIHKEAIAAAGSSCPGHTEMLAALAGGEPTMMLVRDRLRVGLVTTHVALRDVPALVTAGRVEGTARALADGLSRFLGIARPRIAVCGLNPHCSDGGRFGDEEARILQPAIVRLRERGVDAQGPLPADTVFAQALEGRFDAVVAMYHDQGLVAVKVGGLDRVVNVTLGLPIVRTSVGHGTAFDLAGTGRASEGSLVCAARMAVSMVRHARKAG